MIPGVAPRYFLSPSEGKILVADPASKKRSEQEWDISIILDEARKGAAAGGPLWAIY